MYLFQDRSWQRSWCRT